MSNSENVQVHGRFPFGIVALGVLLLGVLFFISGLSLTNDATVIITMVIFLIPPVLAVLGIVYKHHLIVSIVTLFLSLIPFMLVITLLGAGLALSSSLSQ